MKKPKRLYQRLGMGMALVLSFAIVVGITPRIFLAGSPELNPNFLADLGALPGDFVAMFRGESSSKDEQMTAEIPRVVHPSGLNYEPLSKGVYASEADQSGKRYIRIEEGTKLEKKIVTLDDGRTVEVYVPLE